jgi:hypothetical protein
LNEVYYEVGNILGNTPELSPLLVRAMGISEDDTSGFPDVKSTDWFAGAVNAAAKRELQV